MPEETLTVTDNRTGQSVEVPIEDGAIHATALREFGLMSYDPAFLNTASTKSRITYIDGDVGILRYRGYPIEQLAEQSTYLETAYLLLFGELPTESGARRLDARDHRPHVPARERETADGGVPLRRAPDGDVHQRRRGALDVLSGGEQGHGPGQPARAGPPADREGADDRGLLVSPQPRPALRLPGERPRLHRQLPLDDVPHGRAALRGRPGARAGARGAVHPPRRPRAELLGERDALDRLEPRRPVLRARGRRGRPLRAAARRRQRGRAEDAHRDRRREERAGVRSSA